MIIMTPPYQRRDGSKYDLAIEFFNKIMELKPDVIVYYCKTEFFLRDTFINYINSNYKIVSHIFSNAKETFQLSEWAISQIIFDKQKGNKITYNKISVDRYDYDNKNNKLNFIKSYTYDNSRPNLIKDIEHKIKENNIGLFLGHWTNQNYCIVISNRQNLKNKKQRCLLLKGINFNTHAKY